MSIVRLMTAPPCGGCGASLQVVVRQEPVLWKMWWKDMTAFPVVQRDQSVVEQFLSPTTRLLPSIFIHAPSLLHVFGQCTCT